ncbi:MAG: hypothetical protein ACREMA_10540 [Longimicrobiales bacterium]
MRRAIVFVLVSLLVQACSTRNEPVWRQTGPIYLVMEGYCPVVRLDSARVTHVNLPEPTQARTGSLTFRLIDRARNEPVYIASAITLKTDSATRQAALTGVSDLRGTVSFRDVQARRYWALVRPLGYGDAIGHVVVRPGANDTIEVRVPEGAVGCAKVEM